MTAPSGTSAGATEVRDRIFDSALRLFSEKGYAATSLREIADDARTTKPMIYYYFDSKEGLYSHIVHEILEEMAAAIRIDLPGDRTASEQVLAFSERYIRYFIDKEETIALVLREVFGLGGAPMAALAQTLGADVRRPLDDVLREGMHRGEFKEGEVGSCATAVTGILNMFILARVFAGARIDVETPLRQVHYYVEGLQNPDNRPNL